MNDWESNLVTSQSRVSRLNCLHYQVTEKVVVITIKSFDTVAAVCTVQVLLLIDGDAHAYVYNGQGCKKWDTCAPEAILHAVGGLLTDVHGNSYTYEPTVRKGNTRGTLATALASEHKWYLNKIHERVSQSLLPA